MSSSTTYKYEPLDPNDPQAFRLLTLLPGIEEDEIECKLINVSRQRSTISSPPSSAPSSQAPSRTRKGVKYFVKRVFKRSSKPKSLDTTPDSDLSLPLHYEALSYAWGSDETTLPILLDGHAFSITPTLSQSLQRLRYSDRERRLWIDAICIDQSNEHEKPSQIRQMQHIYADASSVIIWLGEESFDSEVAFTFARYIATPLLRNNGGKIQDAGAVIRTDSSFAPLVSVTYRPQWSALHRLLSRPWWRRAWIVQEVLLAQSVFFQCGSTSFPWNELGQAIIVTRATYPQVDRLPRSALRNSNFIADNVDVEAAMELVRARNRMAGCEPEERDAIDASEWLYGNRDRLCKFPHDKVYSILGLSGSAFRNGIKIDYAQSVEECYTAVAKKLIEGSSSLDLLCFSHHALWVEGMPSWVPDWQQTRRCVELCGTINTDDQWVSYKQFSRDGKKLTVKGVILDVVQAVQLEVSLLPGTDKTGNEVDENGNFEVIAHDQCHWTMDTTVLRDLFIPATRRWGIQEFLNDRSTGRELMNMFLKMLSIKKYTESKDRWWYIKTSLPETQSIPDESDWSKFADFQNELEEYLVSRTIIEAGKYIALSPDITEPGDVICLILGCSVPMVLRPIGHGEYKLLGDVFLESHIGGQDSVDAYTLFKECNMGLRKIVLA